MIGIDGTTINPFSVRNIGDVVISPILRARPGAAEPTVEGLSPGIVMIPPISASPGPAEPELNLNAPTITLLSPSVASPGAAEPTLAGPAPVIELGAGFNPNDLSENDIWLSAADLSNMKQERTGASATTAALADSVVGSMFNKGLLGGWAVAPSDASRPILRESAGKYWLEFDGVDDELSLPISGHNSSEAAIVVGVSVEAVDDYFMVFRGDATGERIGMGTNQVDGGAAAAAHASSGSPTTRVDGVAATVTTRQHMHDQLNGETRVMTFESVDISGWTEFKLSGFTGTWRVDGKIYEVVSNNAAFTGTERADAEDFVAASMGITI